MENGLGVGKVFGGREYRTELWVSGFRGREVEGGVRV